MLRKALIATVLLLFALGCLVPGFGEGLSLCIEGGPGGHVAIERGPCGGDGAASPCDPASGGTTSVTGGDCAPCVDLSLGTAAPVRLSPPVAALPVPASVERHLLPSAFDAPSASSAAAPTPGTRTPVRLRI